MNPARISPSDVQAEFKKAGVQAWIVEGHAYRLAIGGCISSKKRKSFEALLKRLSSEVNPNGPLPRLLDAEDIVAWASRFPAVLAMIRGETSGRVANIDAWRRRITELTGEYVAIPEWESCADQIRAHISFAGISKRFLSLAIRGKAGVGKTRLVYEVISGDEAARGLVVYTDDEDEAVGAAHKIAIAPEATAVLVADDCSLEARGKLDSILAGCAARVRVLCLDNSPVRPAFEASDIWLDEMPAGEVAAVLAQNFPSVPPDRRRVYSDVSGGFIRLAAHLCSEDSRVVGGDLNPALGGVEVYIRKCLGGSSLNTLAALSMFGRVGISGNVRSEIDSVCEVTGLDAAVVPSLLRDLKDKPGFVAIAGRYAYITPEVVARVLFKIAWHRWAEADLTHFTRQLPRDLSRQFLERARDLGGEGVRAQLSSTFRGWVNGLTPSALAENDTVQLLCRLVETNPSEFLPCLRGLVEGASDEHLRQHEDEVWLPGDLNPRRAMVWLCERLVAFEEHFQACEAVLFALAHAEVEKGVLGSATSVWSQLFTVVLSGTAVPFKQRLAILQRRAFGESSRGFELSLHAFHAIFSSNHVRMQGPSTVGGRLPPTEWEPKTNDEWHRCLESALRALDEVGLQGGEERELGVREVILGRVTELLSAGFIRVLREVLSVNKLQGDQRYQLSSRLEEYRSRVAEVDPEGAIGVLRSIDSWLGDLRPADLSGRIRALVSGSPYRRQVMSPLGEISEAMTDLARDVLEDTSVLEAELDWLGSEFAKGASVFGDALGRCDPSAQLVQRIATGAHRSNSNVLLRGFARGFIRSCGDEVPKVFSDVVGSFCRSHPALAVDVLAEAGDAVCAFDLALELVDQHAVDVISLFTFVNGIGGRELRSDEIAAVLVRMLARGDAGDESLYSAGVNFAARFVRQSPEHKNASLSDPFDSPSLERVAWVLIESACGDGRGGASYEWGRLVRRLAQSDLSRAVSVAASMLEWQGLVSAREAEDCLVEFAALAPSVVMDVVGAVLLHPKSGLLLQFGAKMAVIENLPASEVMRWLVDAGVTGARRLARHLPIPFLSSTGDPMVPEVTELVLAEFGEDSEVFNAFCIGTHAVESFVGNPAIKLRKDAMVASRFLQHSNEPIRRWAKLEYSERQAAAERADQEFEERHLS